MLRSTLTTARLLLLLAAWPAASADDAATAPAISGNGPGDVLFVGNSFTYYNNSLHNHYRLLRNAAGSDDETRGRVRAMTLSGATLAEHEQGLAQRLEASDWDLVVLQGYSDGPISEGKAESFRQSARDYAAAIRTGGGEPVFFMTWAYTGKPDMTGQLADAYASIGEELDAKVVPVGLAFARALQHKPELELVVGDRKHPTLAGTYLAACTFYAAFHDKSPVGVAYTAGLDGENARYLQRVAWETWQEYSHD